MNLLDKAKELAQQAREKAGPSAAKGLDAASTRLDKATHGKYHEQIENVSNKVNSVLDPHKDAPGGHGKSSQGGTGSQESDTEGPGTTKP